LGRSIAFDAGSSNSGSAGIAAATSSTEMWWKPRVHEQPVEKLRLAVPTPGALFPRRRESHDF